MNQNVEVWFDLYDQVSELSKKKDYHFDQRMLKEISTTLFINSSQNGGIKPEPSYQVPEELKGVDNGNGNRSNGNGYDGNNRLATEKQLKTIRNLLNNDLVTDKEKRRIESILAEPEVSKSTASEILTYFLGNSEKIQGEWVRISQGVLDVRKSKQSV